MVFRVGVVLRVMRKLINRGKGGCSHLCQDSACFPHQVLVIPSNQVANRLRGQITALHQRMMGSQPLGRIMQSAARLPGALPAASAGHEPGSQAHRQQPSLSGGSARPRTSAGKLFSASSVGQQFLQYSSHLWERTGQWFWLGNGRIEETHNVRQQIAIIGAGHRRNQPPGIFACVVVGEARNQPGQNGSIVKFFAEHLQTQYIPLNVSRVLLPAKEGRFRVEEMFARVV